MPSLFAAHGYSRAFTAEFVTLLRPPTAALTADFLLNHPNERLAYAVRRAAMVDVALDRRARRRLGSPRSTAEVALVEVNKLFNRFMRCEEPLLTDTGRHVWVCPVPGSPNHWRLRFFKSIGDERPLTAEERELLRETVASRPLSGLSDREVRRLSAALRSDDLVTAGEILGVEPSRVRESLALDEPSKKAPVDPANDPDFDPDEEWRRTSEEAAAP